MPGHGGMDYDSGGTGSSSSSSYTDEEAQDAVGNILTSTSTVAFTYTDGTPSITAGVVVAQVRAAMGRLQGQTVCTATTTQVYVTPSGVQGLRFHAVGAGGGGAAQAGNASQAGAGQGGQAGGYAMKFVSTTATAYTYIVGTGGAGGVAGANNGTSGTNTTIAGMTAGGGEFGYNMPVGTSVTVRFGQATLGIATGGDVNVNGQPGQAGQRYSATVVMGGHGGPGPWGGGGAGINGNSPGSPGVGPGAGGGGAGVASNSTDRAGGNGADGIIIVEEFY